MLDPLNFQTDFHDIRDITHCSPEFLEVLADEMNTADCPNPWCVNGTTMEPIFDKDGFTIVSSDICAQCLGRGGLYVVSQT